VKKKKRRGKQHTIERTFSTFFWEEPLFFLVELLAKQKHIFFLLLLHVHTYIYLARKFVALRNDKIENATIVSLDLVFLEFG